MLKRRFYRLDEISDVTPLTKGDLLDVVERGEMQLCVWIDAIALGAIPGGKNGATSKALANLFDYRGVVGISLQQSIDSVLSPKTKMHRAIILEPDLVKNWRSVSKEHPDASLVRFSSVSLCEKPTAPFFAFASIGTQTVLSDRGIDALKDKNIFKDEHGDFSVSGLMRAFKDTDVELTTNELEISRDQLRFDLELVTEVFGLETTKDGLQSQKAIDTSDVEIHPLKIMISKAIIGNADANARTVWNLIKRDHQIDAKQIDVDSLISTMNNDEIEWFGQQDTVRITKYKTFQNLLSEVRKGKS
ncbi:hypothetical protein LRP50_12355 [Enterovibrio sp. ZSDZ42]|uniref:Uncharacterized protein n=1 Tax=Enterovibrio gelatinilyticus TaxID=2899819 RepID=A0ABT5R0X1_9GAMM|nr:hypothetical protein [Enterovibrio sp. ZSDZ42]MDD1793927.1 hypothetical protein [Enterovibrio sp. ZSDZ42]